MIASLPLRAGLVVLLAACWLAASAAPAGAHAVLSSTKPVQGALTHDEPKRVVLRFSEPVEAGLGALKVLDDKGEPVHRGKVSQPRADTLAIGLEPGLLGVYTVSYRIVSADGHPISGAFVWGMHVAPGAAALARAERAADEPPTKRSVETAYGAARGLNYAALLLVIGALPFFWFVWRPGRGPADRLPRRLLAGAAVVGLLTALVAVPLHGLVAEGLPLSEITSRAVIDASLDTRTGGAWGIRAVAWLAALVVLLFPIAAFLRMAVLVLPVGVLVATLALAGHASAEEPRGVLAPADVVHVLAAGTWLGGLVLLLVVFWPRRKGSQTTAPDGAAALSTKRFSALALPAVLLLVASGGVQAWFYAGDVSRLTSTSWGLALIAKAALLTTIVALAARNRRAVGRLFGRGATPDGETTESPRSATRLRTAMRVEVALAVVILAATAVLVRSAPPASEAAATPDLKVQLGPMEGHVILQPATTGPNAVTVHVFDRKTGKPAGKIKELTLKMAMPGKDIGPLNVKLKREDPGHYQAPAQSLPAEGEWWLQLDARVSEFDQFSGKRTFEVRGSD